VLERTVFLYLKYYIPLVVGRLDVVYFQTRNGYVRCQSPVGQGCVPFGVVTRGADVI